MTAAARLGDSIAHSAAMGGLLAGLLIGAAVAVAAVAIIGTGGLAAAAMIGAGAATGAGIGQVLGSLSCAPQPVTGTIVATGSFNVYINGIPAARAHVDVVLCSQHPGPPAPIAEGSASVSINSQPAARVGDHTGCSAVISLGSQNVFIGGPTTQTDVMHPEVPSWVSWSIGIVGIGAALVLVGPLVAFAGLVGSLGMGLLGNWLGGKIWGEGSDGQKLSMLGGSILGGWMGIKGGVKFNENYTISVEGLGSNLGNVRITPRSNLENNGVDLALKYKSGWTDAQRAEALAKIKVLNDAPTVVTASQRSGTAAAMSRYRKAEQVLSTRDIDHKIDLQLGGSKEVNNLWSLDSSVNRSLGPQIHQQIKNLPPGTTINQVTIGE